MPQIFRWGGDHGGQKAAGWLAPPCHRGKGLQEMRTLQWRVGVGPPARPFPNRRTSRRVGLRARTSSGAIHRPVAALASLPRGGSECRWGLAQADLPTATGGGGTSKEHTQMSKRNNTQTENLAEPWAHAKQDGFDHNFPGLRRPGNLAHTSVHPRRYGIRSPRGPTIGCFASSAAVLFRAETC